MNSSSDSELQNMTVAEVVTKNYAAAAVFEKVGLDFCCGGNVKLATACESKGLNLNSVVNELNTVLSAGKVTGDKYEQWDLDFLSDYILNNHHTYVREKIPVISGFAERVVKAHGENHPEVITISRLFDQVRQELQGHMFKDVRILFPRLDQMAVAKRNKMKLKLKRHFIKKLIRFSFYSLHYFNLISSLNET